MHKLKFLLIFALLTTTVGCGMDQNSHYMSPERKENGLVMILPGIEGESGFNHDIRRGLTSAGCYRAMPIYSWGVPIPLIGIFVNQTNALGNKAAGRRIAREIEKYLDKYPNAPVYIIGHSGGGGIAVFTAEALGDKYQIDGLILLSASISGNYNLSKALSKCKNGILNIYNRYDGLLVGTVFLGNVDGGRYTSAGLGGFSEEHAKLYQIEVTSDMTRKSGGTAHSAATRPGFISKYVAPWALSSSWPPDTSLLSTDDIPEESKYAKHEVKESTVDSVSDSVLSEDE